MVVIIDMPGYKKWYDEYYNQYVLDWSEIDFLQGLTPEEFNMKEKPVVGELEKEMN